MGLSLSLALGLPDVQSGAGAGFVEPASLSLDFARGLYKTATPYVRTNWLRNSVGVGGTTAGSLPTFWGAAGGAVGLSRAYVGAGTDATGPYVDFRFFGTTNASLTFGLSMEPATQIPAVLGQTWTASIGLALVGGDFSNVSSLFNRVRSFDSSGVTATEAGPSIDVKAQLSSTPRRFQESLTLINVNSVFVTNQLIFTAASGVAIDFTLRIYLPQLEQGPSATSPIATSGTVVSVSTTQSTNLADIGPLTFVNATGGYGVTAAGGLVWFPPNTPRITAGVGLWSEPAATNLCTNTNINPADLTNVTFTNAPNGLATLTVVDDSAALAAIGLSGNVYKLDNTSGDGQVTASPLGANTATTAHALSVYARGAGQLALAVAGEGNANFSTAGYARVVALANPTVTGRRMGVRANPGQVAYFILDQYELGLFASTPIPGAGATRAADMGSFGGSWAAPLTLGVAWTIPSMDGLDSRPIALCDGSVNNRLELYRSAANSGASFVVAAGAAQPTAVASAAKLGARLIQVASRLSAASYAVSYDGAVPSTAAITAPSTLNALFLGRSPASFWANGPVSQVRIYPYAANDAELQQRSAGGW